MLFLWICCHWQGLIAFPIWVRVNIKAWEVTGWTQSRGGASKAFDELICAGTYLFLFLSWIPSPTCTETTVRCRNNPLSTKTQPWISVLCFSEFFISFSYGLGTSQSGFASVYNAKAFLDRECCCWVHSLQLVSCFQEIGGKLESLRAWFLKLEKKSLKPIQIFYRLFTDKQNKLSDLQNILTDIQNQCKGKL